MGCRGSFVIRENGINTYLYDRYFAAGILPDLLYGLNSTLDMFSRAREDETILDEVWGEGGVIVDLDAKVMMFWGSDILLDNVPLIPYMIDFMETVTWQGWNVCHGKWGMLSMAKYLGIAKYPATIQKPSKKSRESHFNWWLDADKNSTKYDEEEETVISYKKSDGSLLHYTVAEELDTTLRLGEDIFKILKDRKTVFLPHQRDVYDCLYIDKKNKTIHIFWGYPLNDNSLIDRLDIYWSGWEIKWIDDGYLGYLKLIGCNDCDLLFTIEEAADRVFNIFRDPIERCLTKLEKENKLDKDRAIINWNNRLSFLDKLKQEWLKKYSD